METKLWAKQLVGPLTLKKQNIIVDDVFFQMHTKKGCFKICKLFFIEKNFQFHI